MTVSPRARDESAGSSNGHDLSLARKIITAGIPVALGELDEKGNPKGWNGWQHAEARMSVLRGYRPGYGVAFVTGQRADVPGMDTIDFDPRHPKFKESVRRLREALGGDMPQTFGSLRTSSSGWHQYVVSLGIPKGPILPGFDYLGGTEDGLSRSLSFIPPTARPSKHPGNLGQLVPYTIDEPLLPLTGEPDGHLRDVLLALRAEHAAENPGRGSREAPERRGGRGKLRPLRNACLQAARDEAGRHDALLAYAKELQNQATNQVAEMELERLIIEMKCPLRTGSALGDARALLLTGDKRPIPDAFAVETADLVGIGGRPAAAGDGGLSVVPDYPTEALRGPLRSLVDCASNLPAALVAGGGLAALAALCAKSELLMPDGTIQPPVLWVPLIAPRDGAKSPALLKAAFRRFIELEKESHAEYRREIAKWSQIPKDERGDKPRKQTSLLGDFTFEKLARMLDAGDGTATVLSDELTGFLSGMGQYKSGARGGSDSSRLLAMWTPEPWHFSRVTDDVEFYIPWPVMTVVGGIQPQLQGRLGDDQSGLRARWLPHYSTQTGIPWSDKPLSPRKWNDVVEFLYERRKEWRQWRLTGAGLARWRSAGARWRQAEGSPDTTATLAGALGKADVQCARVALCLAESLAAADGLVPEGGELPDSCVEMAVAIVDFCMECWRALPSPAPLNITRQQAILRPAIEELLAYGERHGSRVGIQDILRAHVGGVSSAVQARELAKEFVQVYGGEVVKEATGKRGPKREVLVIPKRQPRA